MYKFPDGFLWGTSTSGPQSEGVESGDGKGMSNWDYWFQVAPEKFHNGVGPGRTSTFYKNYKEDIDFLEQTGHTTFRTSIQWSRLIPEGVGEVNQQAVEFYRDVFERINAKGIKLMMNLYHFDLPYALQEKGGWENKEIVYAFRDFAATCFELFGDLVDTWFTFNEPIVPVEAGYLGDFHYPAKHDFKAAIQVGYNTQLASSMAVEACHRLNPDHRISVILNLTPAYPKSDSPEDKKAARIAELFQAKSFLDPSVKGEYPEELVQIVKDANALPEYTDEELDIIKNNTVDFLGVNYYQPLRVQAPSHTGDIDVALGLENYFDNYIMPGRKINPHRGWEIYEQGIYDIAMDIKENYDNIEWILTENGMGVEGEEKFKVDGMIQDDYRIEFIQDHLKELHRAIQDGANCHGYMLWTFIDCWSWLNAYKNRYGLVELDLETQEKTMKKSGYWFKELSENNGF